MQKNSYQNESRRKWKRKIEEGKKLLEATGLPVAYHQFGEEKDLPFLVYYIPDSNIIAADDGVYQKVSVLRVELYTEKKDIAMEALVELVLSNFYYTKSETYIESEKMYEIIYEMEMMAE